MLIVVGENSAATFPERRAAGLGVALVPKTVVEQARLTDVVAAPLAGRQICRRVEVALPKGGHLPRVRTTLVDALAAATAGPS